MFDEFDVGVLAKYKDAEIDKSLYTKITTSEGNEIVVFDDKWVKVKKTDKGFLYLERRNRDSIAVLVCRKPDKGGIEMLVRYQPLCIDHEIHPCPVTGGMDYQGQAPMPLAIKEIEEETGYKIGTK